MDNTITESNNTINILMEQNEKLTQENKVLIETYKKFDNDIKQVHQLYENNKNKYEKKIK